MNIETNFELELQKLFLGDQYDSSVTIPAPEDLEATPDDWLTVPGSIQKGTNNE